MNRRQFQLTTEWSIAASIDSVWQQLAKPEQWPQWWPDVVAVDTLETGDANGVGAYRRMEWRTALPYRLSFNIRTTRMERHRLIEGHSDGALAGVGCWHLRSEGGNTQVRYEWNVELSKRWMRVALPLLSPVFTWNHNRVMEWGRQGLCQRLALGYRPSLHGWLLERYSRCH
jgi:hypothetical protein